LPISKKKKLFPTRIIKYLTKINKRYENTQAANAQPYEPEFLLLNCVYLNYVIWNSEGEEGKKMEKMEKGGKRRGQERYTNMTIPRQKHVKETVIKSRKAIPYRYSSPPPRHWKEKRRKRITPKPNPQNTHTPSKINK
jgi:hypothetical protein